MSEDKKIIKDQKSDVALIEQEQQPTIITYKKKLRTTPNNYIQDNKENYLAFLKENMMGLFSGEIGVYLTSKVNFNGQNLYFPFINIDGDRGFPRKAERGVKIDRTIEDTLCTYKILKKLSADSYFHIIATGNTGFRLVSNILLNIDHYRAFITFLRREMSHIKDIESTELIESKAHQLFAYKHWNQQMKELIDGHSLVIPNHVFENGDMTYEYYQDATKENPDPAAIINFMESFLNFNPISDLNSLGEFGKRLQKYHFPPHEVSIDRTFDKNRINKRRRIPRSQSLG